MSQSTDAYLFYGYCWDDYTEELEDDAYEEGDYDEDAEPAPSSGLITNLDDWAETVLVARGHTNPWGSHPGGSNPEWMASNEKALDDWDELKQAVKTEAGVEWDSHCSDSYPMPLLGIPESLTRAGRGHRKPISSLAVGDDWDARLAAHMQAQGAHPPNGENQPGWWLVSYGEL